MGWEAITHYQEIKEGACLCIHESIQIDGEPRANLIGTGTIKIDLGNQTIPAQFKEATGKQAILVLPNGDEWVMTPTQPNEIGSLVKLTNMHSEDWTIRSRQS